MPSPLLLAWAALVLLLLVRAFAGGLLEPRQELWLTPCAIDVNRAGVAELQALPSVGLTRAEALVLERIRNGPFRELEDLARVPGFGPDLLARIAAYVTF